MDPLSHLLLTRAIFGPSRAVLVACLAPDIPFYATYPAWLIRRDQLSGALQMNDWPVAPGCMYQLHHAFHSLPLIVAPIRGGFMIELTYGPDVDWHKNIVAAGGCTVVRRGQAYVIARIERVDTATGLAAFPPAQRFVLGLLRRMHFEKLLLQQNS